MCIFSCIGQLPGARGHPKAAGLPMASANRFTQLSWLETVAVLYTVWVLFGVIAFVTHLGDDLRGIQGEFKVFAVLPYFLPARGAPRAEMGCRSIVEYFRWNLPLAAIFLVQHSGMRRVRKEMRTAPYFRLLYNFLS